MCGDVAELRSRGVVEGRSVEAETLYAKERADGRGGRKLVCRRGADGRRKVDVVAVDPEPGCRSARINADGTGALCTRILPP